ncbi:MAG: winged helix-turn-helix domain-containing protein [Terriglobales bacterium]
MPGMSSNEVSHRVRFGPYEADLRTHELWKHGTRLKLSGQPFQILEVMLSRPGDLISRDELREKLWPEDTFVDFSHGLNAAVNKLRDALNDSADAPKYIETLPRRGYRFIGQVERPVVPEPLPQPAPAPAAVSVSEPLPSFAQEEEIPAPHGRKFLSLPTVIAVAVLIFVLLVLAIWVRPKFQSVSPEEAERARAEQAQPSTSILEIGIGSHAGTRKVLISAPGRNEGPQFSPDGKRIAFMSDRSGTTEIWVADADGYNGRQLTDLGAGSPRWSPDGKLITFDGRVDGRGTIFVIPAEGGFARPLIRNEHDNLVPRFSRDGQWIYFASDQSGSWQLWKVAPTGGAPVEVTVRGGFAAQEGPDGYLYYADTRFPNPQIWRVPIGGAGEEPVSPRIVPRTWASWTIANNGIYFVEDSMEAPAALSFYDFSTHDIRRVAQLQTSPFWLAVSPDGNSVAVDQPNQP